MQLCDVRLLRQELEEYRRLQEQIDLGGSWKAAAMRQKLRRERIKLAAELWEITKLITAISDPELRLIFELRYFRGFSWKEVAGGLPTLLSADAVRMKHDRYLGKLKQNKDSSRD